MVELSTKEIIDYCLMGYMVLFPLAGAGVYAAGTFSGLFKSTEESPLEKKLENGKVNN